MATAANHAPVPDDEREPVIVDQDYARVERILADRGVRPDEIFAGNFGEHRIDMRVAKTFDGQLVGFLSGEVLSPEGAMVERTVQMEISGDATRFVIDDDLDAHFTVTAGDPVEVPPALMGG